MPIDYSKWDNFDSGSEDEAKEPKATSSTEPAEKLTLGPEHSVPLDDAPPLVHPLSDAAKDFYVSKMTVPQRMHTLVQMWNRTTENDDRVVYLRQLISVLGDPAISDRIKGGQEVLRDLPKEVYEGVTYPPWTDAFVSMSVDQRKEILSGLFTVLPEEEKGMVLTSLV